LDGSLCTSSGHRSSINARIESDTLEFEDFLMYPLYFIGRYDPAVKDARLIDSAFLGHSRRQLLANAAIASSRVVA
jgi:hypothetical protein